MKMEQKSGKPPGSGAPIKLTSEIVQQVNPGHGMDTADNFNISGIRFSAATIKGKQSQLTTCREYDQSKEAMRLY